MAKRLIQGQMMSYCMTNDVICSKMFVDSDQRMQNINSSYLATLLLKLQWHARIYDETFVVDSSSNNAKYLTFYGRKVDSARNSNFGDYPGDIRL